MDLDAQEGDLLCRDKDGWNNHRTTSLISCRPIRRRSRRIHSLSGQNARYVKVVAENFGECPPWHLGAGGQGWLFVDELVIGDQRINFTVELILPSFNLIKEVNGSSDSQL